MVAVEVNVEQRMRGFYLELWASAPELFVVAAKALSDIAVRKNKTCHIHIKIDTGMSRIGLQVTEDSADLIAGIAKLPNIEIEGIFTHFAQADEYDKTPTQKQIALFQKMITMLEERNVKIPIHHCSNSAGIVEIPEANMDMVRAGITLYGMWPSEEVAHNISLHPVMSLKSHIAFVKTLGKGRKISYGGIYEMLSSQAACRMRHRQKKELQPFRSAMRMVMQEGFPIKAMFLFTGRRLRSAAESAWTSLWSM